VKLTGYRLIVILTASVGVIKVALTYKGLSSPLTTLDLVSSVIIPLWWVLFPIKHMLISAPISLQLVVVGLI